MALLALKSGEGNVLDVFQGDRLEDIRRLLEPSTN
jgi:hypothetical protein